MFGELVCGPPGSGKTTYCEGKRQFLSVYDATRPVTLLNLDPANEGVFPYPCDVDVRELVDHATVMQDEQLGPNGSYLFCLDVMARHLDWIVQRVQAAVERRVREVLKATTATPTTTTAAAVSPRVRAPYLIIDCPGQVEFYVNSRALHDIIHALQKRLRCTLCTVHLVDAGVATRDVASYVSSCLLCLTTMIDHELPHVNVLSKWDTLANLDMTGVGSSNVNNDDDDDDDDTRGPRAYLNFSNFLGDGFDRQWRRQLRERRHAHRMAQYHVTPQCPTPRLSEAHRRADEALDTVCLHTYDGGDGNRRGGSGGRWYAYTKALTTVIDGYGLVGFLPLDIHSQNAMLRITREVDNAVGNFV